MDAQREQQEEAEIENSYSKEISSLDDAIDDCIIRITFCVLKE
jgi:hypothetical protein